MANGAPQKAEKPPRESRRMQSERKNKERLARLQASNLTLVDSGDTSQNQTKEAKAQQGPEAAQEALSPREAAMAEIQNEQERILDIHGKTNAGIKALNTFLADNYARLGLSEEEMSGVIDKFLALEKKSDEAAAQAEAAVGGIATEAELAAARNAWHKAGEAILPGSHTENIVDTAPMSAGAQRDLDEAVATGNPFAGLDENADAGFAAARDTVKATADKKAGLDRQIATYKKLLDDVQANRREMEAERSNQTTTTDQRPAQAAADKRAPVDGKAFDRMRANDKMNAEARIDRSMADEDNERNAAERNAELDRQIAVYQELLGRVQANRRDMTAERNAANAQPEPIQIHADAANVQEVAAGLDARRVENKRKITAEAARAFGVTQAEAQAQKLRRVAKRPEMPAAAFQTPELSPMGAAFDKHTSDAEHAIAAERINADIDEELQKIAAEKRAAAEKPFDRMRESDEINAAAQKERDLAEATEEEPIPLTQIKSEASDEEPIPLTKLSIDSMSEAKQTEYVDALAQKDKADAAAVDRYRRAGVADRLILKQYQSARESGADFAASAHKFLDSMGGPNRSMTKTETGWAPKNIAEQQSGEPPAPQPEARGAIQVSTELVKGMDDTEVEAVLEQIYESGAKNIKDIIGKLFDAGFNFREALVGYANAQENGVDFVTDAQDTLAAIAKIQADEAPLDEEEQAALRGPLGRLWQRVKRLGRKPLIVAESAEEPSSTKEERRAARADIKDEARRMKEQNESLRRTHSLEAKMIDRESLVEAHAQMKANKSNARYEADTGMPGMAGARLDTDAAEKAWFDRGNEIPAAAAKRAAEANFMDLATPKELLKSLDKHGRDVFNTLMAKDPTTGEGPTPAEVAQRVADFTRFPDNGPIPKIVIDFLRTNVYLAEETAQPTKAEATVETAKTSAERVAETFTAEEAQAIVEDFGPGNKKIAAKLMAKGITPQEVVHAYLNSQTEGVSFDAFVRTHASELFPEDAISEDAPIIADRPQEAVMDYSEAWPAAPRTTTTEAFDEIPERGAIVDNEAPFEAAPRTNTAEAFDETPERAAVVDNEAPFEPTAKKSAERRNPVVEAQLKKISDHLPRWVKDADIDKVSEVARELIHKWNVADGKDYFNDSHQLGEAVRQAIKTIELSPEGASVTAADTSAAMDEDDSEGPTAQVIDFPNSPAKAEAATARTLEDSQKELKAGWTENPYQRTASDQDKFAWNEVYQGLAENDPLRKDADKLRFDWARKDGFSGDYPANSDQWKLQTGEALRQVGEMQKQKRDIRASLPKDVLNADDLVEDVRNRIHNLNVAAGKDYFTQPDVVKSAVGLALLDSQKSEFKALQQKILAEKGPTTNENDQKMAWFKVYKDKGKDNEVLKKRVDILRDSWAEKDGVTYTEGSETYKEQTGEALRQLVDGVVKMKLDDKGNVVVNEDKAPPPTTPAAAKKQNEG